ncbi:DUF4097 family beta strand repeat-containing protein [Phocicoccus pinnipedialis]|uniref:Uncharacterized protein n=1 Tax=Phocicoccus pinnipedialis TaxID=110845 RepID=A0A6V7R3C1_9BACL|nr:DUF4097 family beta strand repeat-containing protein [Jeotgalicoccus pinnipedialis]MBP1938792.1 DUF4097 and DUF4098 domain-containing protein YvlB [Jeotgalicoccus pinnipedialis]CAD2071564.1 hypothetical protein JEOPIN946_00103 [Jeotgalicoccus pinnipedialis]
MNSKERILKLLEDGKITTAEAIDLMNALNYKTEDMDVGSEEEPKVEESEHQYTEKDNNPMFQFFEQMTDEVGKYVDIDKIEKNMKDTFQNVKSSAENQAQFKQVVKTFEKTFDSVKNTNIDSIFSKGTKNRMIETLDLPFKKMSIDVTNGNVSIKPTTGTTVVRFEVTPFYHKLDKKRNYFQDIVCEVKDEELIILSPLRSAKVNVEVEVNPLDLKRLIVSGSNGNIDVKDIATEDLTVDILNGDITVDHLMVKTGFLRTSKGQVDVDKGQYDALEVVTMLGSVKTDELNAREIDIHSNGSVNLSVSDKAEVVSVNTNVGGINIEVPAGTELAGRLSTVMGNLNYPPGLDTRYMKPSDFGLKEVMILNDKDTGLVIEASTKIGSITLHRN